MKNLIRNTLVRDFIGATFCLTMAFALLMMYSGCSENASSPINVDSPINVVEGGAAEETGVYALQGRATSLPEVWKLANESGAENLGYATSIVKIYELNAQTLEKTGVVFEGSIVNVSGEFFFDSVSLHSPYVMLEVYPYQDGFWSGEQWFSDYTPYNVIVDLRETKSVNVNVMTYLETFRLRRLVKSGMSFTDAKQRADREVLDAFGIYDVPFNFEKNEHAADPDVVDVLEFIDSFLGTLSNSTVETIGRRLGDNGNLDSLPESTESLFVSWTFLALNRIMKAEGQGSSSMSALSKQLYTNFAIIMHDVEECTTEKEGLVIENPDVVFNFKCTSGKWNAILKSVPFVGDSVTDARDGKTYKTVTYEIENGTQTWFAENLKYGSDNGEYSLSEVMALDSTIVMISYEECMADNGVEDWCDTVTAMGNHINYDRFLAAIDSVERVASPYQGICPDGWHLPTGTEWENLFGYLGRTLDMETRGIAEYMFTAGFGTVTEEQVNRGEITKYYAVKPDSGSSEEPLATMVRVVGRGKWLITQRALWEKERIKLNVRCIKN